MPIYEYRCKKCNRKFELLVFSKDEQPKCEHCGSVRVEKLISSFASTTGGSSPQMPSTGGGCGPSCGCHGG